VNASRIIDIVGAALILGLILRWGPEAAALIGALGSQTTTFFKAVSLQDIKAPSER
jgi:hypothetical protein